MTKQKPNPDLDLEVRELLGQITYSDVLHDAALLAAAELSKNGHLEDPTIYQLTQVMTPALEQAMNPGYYDNAQGIIESMAFLLFNHADIRKHLAAHAKELGYALDA